MMVRWGEGEKVPVDTKHKLEVKTRPISFATKLPLLYSALREKLTLLVSVY